MSDPIPSLSHARTILSFLWSQRRTLRRGVWLGVGRSLVLAPTTLLFRAIMDSFAADGNVAGIIAAAIVFIGLMLLHFAFAVRSANEIGREISLMLLALRAHIFEKMHLLNFAYLDRQKTGRLLSKYAFDTQRIEGVSMWLLSQFLPSIFYCVAVIVIIISMQWQMALILLLILPVFAFSYKVFHWRLRQRNEALRRAQEALTGTASELINALRLVRSLGEEKQVTDQINEDSAEVAQSRLDMVHLSTVFGVWAYVITQLFSLLVVAGGAYFVIRGAMTFGTLLAFVAALPILLQPVGLLTGFSEQYFLGQESFRSVRELLDSTAIENWRGRRKLPTIRGEVVFDRVDFRYPSSPDLVLRNFNLRIEPGEQVALVGPSGSGKSTLTYLILGLYKWERGQVRVDGVPLEELDMRWFRRQCAVVMQENVLLSGSVRDNIRFARPDATDEQVMIAARQANAEEFILQLPQGYDTAIGERGATLSGGQRQRLSIARAILRDPRVLILDEATSALDYESERLVQDALRRLTAGRTVITIAHRLSTVKDANRIIVLRDGEMIEQGSYTELVARGGYFADLLQAQTLLSGEERNGANGQAG